MTRQCEICGKKAAMGNKVAYRGKAKRLGGVGIKITGISRRQFRPNLHRIRVVTANGTHKRIRVCAQCIRQGAVTKIIKVPPFRLPKIEGVNQAAESAGQ